MRVLLLFLLMLALPMQSVWSAAAAVCTHENAGASPHFGHHVEHHEDDHSTDAGDLSLSGAADDHHHLVAVHPVPFLPSLPLISPLGAGVRSDGAEPFPHALIAALERPPRSSADIRSAEIDR